MSMLGISCQSSYVRRFARGVYAGLTLPSGPAIVRKDGICRAGPQFSYSAKHKGNYTFSVRVYDHSFKFIETDNLHFF